MVDFWEVFGRLLANDGGFRLSVYNAVPVGDYQVDPNKPALLIPQGSYKVARTEAAKVIKGRPVSLMALGELLMCVSSQKFRDRTDALIDAMKQTGVDLTGRGDLFYAALGLMMVDDQVRGAFSTGPSGFDDVFFGSLNVKERADLTRLADPKAAVKNAANLMCELFWLPACNAKLKLYPTHIHPIANPYPPKLP